MKFHVAADGPELRRIYALAADLHVPILVHFQEVDHFPNEGHVEHRLCADVRVGAEGVSEDDVHRARGRVLGQRQRRLSQRSGLSGGPDQARRRHRQAGWATIRISSATCSANSGNNALSRDPEFTAEFLKRHQDKLLFGSDCSCSDGHGAGVSQANNPAAARLAGKCVARETLRRAQAIGLARRSSARSPGATCTSCCGFQGPRHSRSALNSVRTELSRPLSTRSGTGSARNGLDPARHGGDRALHWVPGTRALRPASPSSIRRAPAAERPAPLPRHGRPIRLRESRGGPARDPAVVAPRDREGDGGAAA